MPTSPQHRPLEPQGAAGILVVAVHLMLAAGIFTLCWNKDSIKPALQTGRQIWYTPADFLMMRPMDAALPLELTPPAEAANLTPTRITQATEPAAEISEALSTTAAMQVQKTQPATALAQKTYSKMIKLSPMHASGLVKEPPPRPIISLLDVARLAEKEPDTHDNMLVELQGALMEAWELPRELAQKRHSPVILRLRLLADGSAGEAGLERSSDDEGLDKSALEAAKRMKKISTAQAANLPKEGYSVEVTFQIE